MKPVYLEFCGINSFSEKAVIDFRSLLEGGVFGIFGDTGSGKSTILDCIHLALYGRIERSSGSECIHYALDSAYVVFDFEITKDGVRRTYRVRRERRRKNNIAKAWLYELKDQKTFAIAEGTRDVDDAIEEIIGLTFADFKTCIALPQGDFATLVKASTSDRVKLVSRLFDLEKYGEKLFKATSERFYQAENEVALIKAKMGQCEEVSEELLESKRTKVQTLKTALDGANVALQTAQSEYERIKGVQKAKAEYDALCKELSALSVRYPQMQEKLVKAERIPSAKAVIREAESVESAEKAVQKATDGIAISKTREERAIAELEIAKKTQADGHFDEEILAVRMALGKVQGAQADILAEQKARENYENSVREYKKLQKLYLPRDFATELAALEKRISELGEDETVVDYLKHRFKDVLVADAYGEFREDLRALGEKYPETEKDVGVLLEKYTLSSSEGKTLDLAQAQLAFKEQERKRKALQEERKTLEEEERKFQENESKKKAIAEQGKIYHETWLTAQEKTKEIKTLGSEEELQKKLSGLEREKTAAQVTVDRAQNLLNGARADIQTQTALLAEGEQKREIALADLGKVLKETGFYSVEEARALLKELPDELAVKAECKNFFDRYELLKSKYDETDGTQFAQYDESALLLAEYKKTQAQAYRDGLQSGIAVEEKEIQRLLGVLEKYRAFETELKTKEKERELCEELRNLLKGNKFLEFIASEYLQEICVYASQTLLSLTSGRYFLRYDKEFRVGDNLDGGNLRAVKTLSGGETFLVSLSLALSLGTAICQKSLRPIEFFFLDEGFGTLDDKLVDTVMDVLGKLKSKSLSVGLISHVEELKRRIDNKILVTGANESHGSQVRLERF